MHSPDIILRNTYSYKARTDMQDCPICYTIIAKGDNLAVSSCDHTFHYDCMKRWIQTISQRQSSYREGCPMCRGNLEIKHKYNDIIEQVVKRKEEVEREREIEREIKRLNTIKNKEKEHLNAFHKIFSKSCKEYKYSNAIKSHTNKNLHKQSKHRNNR